MGALKFQCDSLCEHVNGDPYPHETKLLEDAGEIHTDDCGFFSKDAVESERDPGDFCTAGWPCVTCRVFSRAKDLPVAPLGDSKGDPK